MSDIYANAIDSLRIGFDNCLKEHSTLDELKLGTSTKPGTVPNANATGPAGGSLTADIHIRREHWDLLRRVAFARAQASGGRASVSAVIPHGLRPPLLHHCLEHDPHET